MGTPPRLVKWDSATAAVRRYAPLERPMPHWTMLFLAGALLIPTPGRAEAFRPDDVCAPVSLDDPRLSPDGSAVVFVVRSCDVATNESTSDLWYVATAPGSEPVQLTTDPADEWSPRWSPDGTSLAFVSTRAMGPQIWRFDGFFGEPRQITHQPGGATGPVWTPDGRQLLYTSRGPGVELDELAGEDVGVHRDLLYRKGAHREQGRFAHIYRVDAAGGEGTRITYGDHDFSEPAVSPDGATLAVTRDADHAGGVYSIDTDVWLIPLQGGTLEPLSDNPGPDQSPVWRPDGGAVMTRSILEEGYESGRRRLLSWPVGGGEPTELTAGADQHVFWAWYTPDGEAVEAIVDGPGTWHLATLPAAGGPLAMRTAGRSWIWDAHAARQTGDVVLIVTDPVHPGELWLLPAGADRATLDFAAPQGARPLTAVNAAFEASRSLSSPDVHWIDSPSGRRIQLWYYPPTTAIQGPRRPLILTLHGGPQWMVGERWDPEIQALAGAGHAVLAVNFTGSMGYGQAFMDAIIGDWGGAPMQDALAAVDWAVAEGLADPDRLGVTGGSYGGFLVAYLIGHDPRFKAAVPCRSVINQVSAYGTTDEQFFDENDIPGTPWSNPEGYRQWSPITHADQITTPTLIIHSDDDTRVPIGQAEELFTALIRHGVEAELVRFPDEGHGLSRRGTPVHRRERLRHMVRWFQTYLK